MGTRTDNNIRIVKRGNSAPLVNQEQDKSAVPVLPIFTINDFPCGENGDARDNRISPTVGRKIIQNAKRLLASHPTLMVQDGQTKILQLNHPSLPHKNEEDFYELHFIPTSKGTDITLIFGYNYPHPRDGMSSKEFDITVQTNSPGHIYSLQFFDNTETEKKDVAVAQRFLSLLLDEETDWIVL